MEWNGFYGTDYEKGLMIKRNLFLSPSKERDKEGARSWVSLYEARKKRIYLKGYGINHILLPLSLASNFFEECFAAVKI